MELRRQACSRQKSSPLTDRFRIANACTNPDLFWALKGGGGGTFGVISKITLKLHDLPEYFCAVNFTIKAPSDDAYRRLVRQFVSFYRKSLFNDHWGEQARIKPDNSFEIQMLGVGLDSAQGKEVWQPFLDWVRQSPDGYSVKFPVVFAGIPARHFWDVEWWKSHWAEAVFANPNGNPLRGLFDYSLEHLIGQPTFTLDPRADAAPNNAWWKGNTFECGWFIHAYQSLWLPESLLGDDASQERLADALYEASRHSGFEMHFNKGLAGAPPDAIAAARDTCTNPAVLTAFTLVIAGDAEAGPVYPGIPGHEPSVDAGREGAKRVDQCMNELRAVAPNGGAYVSESNFFEKGFQQSYWGSNYRAARGDQEEIRSRRTVRRPQRSRLGAVERRRLREVMRLMRPPSGNRKTACSRIDAWTREENPRDCIARRVALRLQRSARRGRSSKSTKKEVSQ